eukprot:scpid55077/ scgid14903/ Nuclear valosin-containing protein-like
MAKRMKSVPSLDRRLAPRIQEYVDSHPGNIQVDTMALALQEQYGDYRRRPRIAFRLLVNQVYMSMKAAAPEANRALPRHPPPDTTADLMAAGCEEGGSEEIGETAGGQESMSQDEGNFDQAGEATKPLDESVEPKPKRRKLKRRYRHTDDEGDEPSTAQQWETKESKVTLDDFYGYEQVKKATFELIDVFAWDSFLNDPASGGRQPFAVGFDGGLLLHGPSGCGKTLLAHAIAGSLHFPILEVQAAEVVSGISGDSEKNLRQLFQTAREKAPCVLLLDKLEAIAPKTENAGKQMEARLVHQLASCCEGLFSGPPSSVLLIGIAINPDTLDPSLRQSKRFGAEFCVDYPDESSRHSILQHLCADTKLESGVSLKQFAHNTPGYSGGDLCLLRKYFRRNAADRLAREKSGVDSRGNFGAQCVIDRQFPPEDLLSPTVTTADFREALRCVVPSGRKGTLAHIPDVSWSDVGALQLVKKELSKAILSRVHSPEMYRSLGMPTSSGVLLVGPPGCGKTLVAKAVANESSINFLSVKGPEVFNMYVGESERAVRQLFERARSATPCVIFFDEIDSLATRRTSSSDGHSTSRVVNTLLTEMDGAGDRGQVFVICTTNRPDILDPAILRPGRLDTILYVGIPDAKARAEILRAQTKNGTKPRLAEDVDLDRIAGDERCEGLTGSDLKLLLSQACDALIEERHQHYLIGDQAMDSGQVQPGSDNSLSEHNQVIGDEQVQP